MLSLICLKLQHLQRIIKEKILFIETTAANLIPFPLASIIHYMCLLSPPCALCKVQTKGCAETYKSLLAFVTV